MSAFWLRLLACVTMLIDHYGALYHPSEVWYRIIGRLAFPIFAFLIANGFRYTRNPLRYLARLFIFALISEAPYDHYLYGGADPNFLHQNIFLTLALGLAALIIDDYLQKRIVSAENATQTEAWNPLLSIVVVAGISLVAEVTHASYGFVGILSVYIMYLWNRKRLPLLLTALLLGVIYNPGTLQIYAVFSLIPLALYNAQPGPRNIWVQYGFYLFYPVHLLALHFLPLT